MRAADADLLERAISLAVQAHAGQRDDDGSPYILHPLRVMQSLRDPHEQMTAVLHDVVEQTAVTAPQLRTAGMPDAVVQAVEILTRPPTESRMAAARRAATHPLARAVKRADVCDNMLWWRIPRPEAADHARMREYAEVLAYLDGR